MDSPSGGMWTVMTIVGPLLLAAVLLWALLRNRSKSSPGEVDRTERATHDLYDEETAVHRGEDDRVP
jgi:hypothetical protein